MRSTGTKTSFANYNVPATVRLLRIALIDPSDRFSIDPSDRSPFGSLFDRSQGSIFERSLGSLFVQSFGSLFDRSFESIFERSFESLFDRSFGSLFERSKGSLEKRCFGSLQCNRAIGALIRVFDRPLRHRHGFDCDVRDGQSKPSFCFASAYREIKIAQCYLKYGFLNIFSAYNRKNVFLAP